MATTTTTKVGYVTDVEGDHAHWVNYVRGSDVLHFDSDGRVALRDGCTFVFGGDAFDRGVGDLRVGGDLVDLKRRYGERVVLLMGNRDINKMRFTSELSLDVTPSAAFSAWWDAAAPTLVEHYHQSGLPDSVLHRLQWALRHTLGCPSTFEFRREELRLLTRTAHVSDATVLQSFVDSATDGIYYQYLRCAQLAYCHGDTLFVHGAADARGLRFVPSLRTRFVRNERVEGTHIDDLHEWVRAINAFAQHCVDEWKTRPTWQPDGTRGGEALLAYQNKPAICNQTVCVHSYVDGLNIADAGATREGFEQRSDPYDANVRAYLRRFGVTRVVVGHTPSGEAPATYVDDTGFTIVSADTNYASGSGRGGSWAEVVLESDGAKQRCRLHGALADARGTYDCYTDEAHIGTRTRDGYWVKVRLASGAYLQSRGRGRQVESRIERIEPTYLDVNGTTPLSHAVRDAMHVGVDELWGNAGTDGPYGTRARAAIAQGVARVAQLIGCESPSQVIITSGGTEANNMALRGAVVAARAVRGVGSGPVHCVTTTFEHPAVENVFRALEQEGVATVTRVPVGCGTGLVDANVFRGALQPGRTCLVSIMHANNEVGTLQDIAALVGIARQVCGAGLVFHTDAAQSVGKVPVNVQAMDVDLLTLVGHKFYAPKAVGALYVRDARCIALPFLQGGSQQGNRRAGTESALLVDALGVAAAEAHRHLEANRAHMSRVRDAMWARVQQLCPHSVRHTPMGAADALPNTLSVMLHPQSPPAYELVRAAAPFVLCAAGAACHHGCTTPSATLLAMGVDAAVAIRTLRLSVGTATSEAEAVDAVAHLARLAAPV